MTQKTTDWWRHGDRASAVVAAEVAPAVAPSWTPYGVACLAVGALLRGGWVLVPPAAAPAMPTRPPEWLAGLIERREAARRVRDFATADALRAEAAGRGYVLEDSKDGSMWRRG